MLTWEDCCSERIRAGPIWEILDYDTIASILATVANCRLPKFKCHSAQENCKVLRSTAILAVTHGQDARATTEFSTLQFSCHSAPDP